MLLQQPPPANPTLHHPVYVLSSEREKHTSVDAMSITDIDNKILDVIEKLDERMKNIFGTFYVIN